jgi:hypothetical protein
MAEIELAAASGTRPPLRSRERRIIAAIGAQALVAKQIAKLIDVEFNKGLQAVLADMVRWGLLTHDAEGYRVGEGWAGTVVEDEAEDDAT